MAAETITVINVIARSIDLKDEYAEQLDQHLPRRCLFPWRNSGSVLMVFGPSGTIGRPVSGPVVRLLRWTKCNVQVK